MPADPDATNVSPVSDIEKGSVMCVALGGVFFIAVTVVGVVFFLLGQTDPTGIALDAAAACGTLSHQTYETMMDTCKATEGCNVDLIPHYWGKDAGCVYFSGTAVPLCVRTAGC
jgi:hypothetical protein